MQAPESLRAVLRPKGAGVSGVLGTLTDDQQQVCRLLPYPLASVWREVLSASSSAQLESALHLQIEVTARLLAIVLFCDYLRGPLAEPVEELVAFLDRGEAEHWLALTTACLDALVLRHDPPMLMPQALEWRRRKATSDKSGLGLLESLVQQRRAGLVNVIALPSQEAAQQAELLLHATADLLSSLRWLGAWRLLRVVDLTTLRHRGFAGHVQLFQGAADTPEPQPAAWTAHLVADALYLVDPTATQLLEVSPLLRILPHPRTRKPLCFLFDASPRHDALVLAHHASGVRVETTIAGPDGPMAMADWLARRAEHGSWLSNVDLDRTLTVDLHGQAFAPPDNSDRPRPISDLSQAAFLPIRPATSASGWRSRAALAIQLAVVLVLTLVTLATVAPRFRKVSADISDDAARPRPRPGEPAPVLAPLAVPASPQLAGAQPSTTAASSAQRAAVAVAPVAVAAVAATTDAPPTPPRPTPVPPVQVVAAAPPAAPAQKGPVPGAAPQGPAEAAVAKAESPSGLGQAVAKVQVPTPAPLAPSPLAKPALAKPELAKPEPVKPEPVKPEPVKPPPLASPPVVAQRGPHGDLGKVLKEFDIRPGYALLKLTIAKRQGQKGADAALAQAYLWLKQTDRCRHHSLLALKQAPQDAAVLDVASRCKAQASLAQAEPDPPIDSKDLANRLYAEAYSIIYGAGLPPALRRQLAKDLYSEAAQLGLGRAHVGLAAIYLYGESNRAKCLHHALAAIQLGEKGQAVKLRDQCGP